MEKPLISVIIPAYNEEKYIEKAINSIKQQSYNNTEVIVVANNCRDKTAEIAAQSADIVLQTDIQSIPFVKNLGVEHANGEIFVFMDADSMAKKDLLDKVYHYVSKGFDGGKARLRYVEGNNFIGLSRSFLSMIVGTISALIPKKDFSGSGAFMFVTKNLFNKIKNVHGEGFNTKIRTLSDVDFLTRIKQNGKFKYITNSCLYTSMRRFNEEGHIKCMIEDWSHVTNNNGQTRKRWT